MEVEVLCIGYASYDLIFTVEHHPEADEKCFASGYTGAGGGPAANAAVTVARLGGKAAFAGYLGNDTFGGLHFEELRSEGVVTELVVRGGHPTPLSAIIVKPDGSRSVVAHRAATPLLLWHQVDFSRVCPKVMLFDGHEPGISLSPALEARKNNIPVVLDAGSVHKGTTELAPLSDYLIASEKFARDFTGKTEPRDALRALARTAPVVVITLGGTGLIWAAGNAEGRLDAFPVETVDTTGAGDILHGAFALRLARGDGLLTALRYASAAAALGCTKTGARAGIPGKDKVEGFLKSFEADATCG
ncbi:MAG: PfkB family carbohydrate kinase [Syntrophobacteraceae bacterium]